MIDLWKIALKSCLLLAYFFQTQDFSLETLLTHSLLYVQQFSLKPLFQMKTFNKLNDKAG